MQTDKQLQATNDESSGHETVALVAYKHLSDSTAQYLDDLLNFQNPKGYDFADSATWADRVKLPRPYSKPWHYIGESNDFLRASKTV